MRKLDSFSKLEGNCRVVFATIAFGMGVNIPDIHTVIHLGPSSNVDNYLQESGRVGCDGVQSDAVSTRVVWTLLINYDSTTQQDVRVRSTGSTFLVPDGCFHLKRICGIQGPTHRHVFL